MKSSKTVSHT